MILKEPSKNWGDIKHLAWTVSRSCFTKNSCHVPSDMNESLICLIPKQEHPDTIAQIRPIRLSNVVIKIISKVIANWLKPLMKELVGMEQSSFIPSRHTTDHIVVAQEVIHSFRHKKGKRGSMVAKIALEKAYDSVDLGFLEEVIGKVGFERSFINVILNCIKSLDYQSSGMGNDCLPSSRSGVCAREIPCHRTCLYYAWKY